LIYYKLFSIKETIKFHLINDFFKIFLFFQMEGKLAASQIPHVSPFLRVI